MTQGAAVRKWLLILCLLQTGSVWAQGYIEIGSSFLQYRNKLFSGASIEANQQVMGVLLGYEYAPDWSAELITGLAQLAAKPVQVNGYEVADLKMEFKRAFGVFVKRQIPLTSSTAVAARLGYTSVNGSGSYLGYTESFRGDGLSYSLGLRYTLNPRTYLATDYVSLLDKGDLKIRALTVGVGYRF